MLELEEGAVGIAPVQILNPSCGENSREANYDHSFSSVLLRGAAEIRQSQSRGAWDLSSSPSSSDPGLGTESLSRSRSMHLWGVGRNLVDGTGKNELPSWEPTHV